MDRTVLVTDHVFGDLEAERAALAAIGCRLEQAPAPDSETLAAHAAGAAGMLVCFADVGEDVVDAAARGGCRIIARYGIGVDNVAVDAATRAGIQVTNVPDYCLDEVADHAMAMLLAGARRVVSASRDVAEGGWTPTHGQVHRLAGRRLALLGVGQIGSRVLTRARAFGLEVVGYDPFLADPPEGLTMARTPEEAVAEADYVSLHAPLNDATHHLVGEELIGAMRRAPMVINTSRGGLVDLDAAVAALDAGQVSILALDVTEVEPLPAGHPLRTHPRAIVTPHMAFYSIESTRELQQRVADEVVAALRGEPARSPVA